MSKTKAIHELLTDQARTLLARMLRVRETDPNLVLTVGIDTSRAAAGELHGRTTCSVQSMPRRRALQLYGHRMTPQDTEMLTAWRPLTELAVLVIAGEDVAVGAMQTAYPSSTAA